MHSRTIVLAVGLLAAPLSLLASPDVASSGPSAVWLAAASSEDTVNGRLLTPAPVPNDGALGVSAGDRVAEAGSRALDAGPANSTPFSGTPTGTLSGGAEGGSQRDRVAGPDRLGATPNLGK